jgi:AMP-binding enzyme C-terminal domain
MALAAAVFGVPDRVLGQRVAAIVRLSNGAGDAALGDILRDTRRQLADYKAPERLLPTLYISWCAGAVVESFKIANRTVLDLLAEGRHGKGGTSHRHGARGPRKIARASKTPRSRQRPPTTIIRYRGVTCIGHPVAVVILWRQPLVTTGGAVGYLPIGAFPIGALPT